LTGRLGIARLIDRGGRGQLDAQIVKLPNIARITDLAAAVSVVAR
jgi:hypothetical protein